jgi:hypothetical protein
MIFINFDHEWRLGGGQALSGYAEVLIQVGEADTAYKALMRCIELSPEGDGTPYLNLAQISEGLDAVGYFTKGIELLVKKRAALFAEVRHTCNSCNGHHHCVRASQQADSPLMDVAATRCRRERRQRRW